MERSADKRRSLRMLDALAFLAPDVQGGVGPFLVVFMSASLHWDAGRVGTVMFFSAVVGILVQAPGGALVDRVRSKSRWIAAALAAIAASVLMMMCVSTFPVILLGQSAIGTAGAVIAPGLAALSLGLVGRTAIEARIGRNAALSAAGTVTWALCTGIIGHYFGPRAMFLYAVAMGAPAILAALGIRDRDIDQALARGADRSDESEGSGWLDRRLFLVCSCCFLFHLANAALLTLIAQEVSAQAGDRASLYLSANLVVTQLMTIGISLLVGRFAQRWPRKPIVIVAFSVLPVRALLYLGVTNPLGLIALQVLDGIGAGILVVMQIVIVGDLTRGSGRFNLGQGILSSAVGAGAAFSNLLGGTVAQRWGYDASFLTLAAIAGLALLLVLGAMPETRSTHAGSGAVS